MRLLYRGAAQPDGVICYGVEKEIAFRAPWTPWLRLVDIDGDGKLDLVRFGAFCQDEVFLNRGTRERPLFDYLHTLSPIPLERYVTDIIYGVGPYPNTQRTAIDVVDWDGDGGKDLIINGAGRFEVYLDRGLTAEPRWEGPVLLCTTKGVLTVVHQAVARMVDWDGDGKPDLLFTTNPPDPKNPTGIGGYCPSRSEIFFCRNIGTRREPLFDEPVMLTAGGKPFGDYFHGFACFEAIDWDGDGDLDLLVGSGDNGHLYFVENIGTRDEPRLAAPVLVEADGKPIDLEHYIAPAAADWNGDGKLDLAIGTRPGYVYLFENQAATKEERPKLKSAGKITTPPHVALQTPIGPGVYISISIVDWDGDGVKDLIAGYENGNIGFYKNVGLPGQWKFEPERLIRTTEDKPIWLTDMADGKLDFTPDGNTRFGLYSYTAPAIADLTGDGRLDMLVSMQGPMLWVLYNAGPGQEPRMRPPQLLRVGDNPYHCPCRVRPGLVDFDGDGIPDMIHVNPEFQITYHKGRRDRNGYFVEPGKVLLNEKGQPIRLRPGSRPGTEFNQHPRTQFEVVDWDGDGRLDLLIGTVDWSSPFPDCELLFLRNIGSNAEPVFHMQRMLVDGRPFIKPDSDHDISTATVDWNGDGVLDLLVGTTEGWIFRYDGRRFSR